MRLFKCHSCLASFSYSHDISLLQSVSGYWHADICQRKICNKEQRQEGHMLFPD